MSRYFVCDVVQDSRHRFIPCIRNVATSLGANMAAAINVVGGVASPSWCLCSVSASSYDDLAAVPGADILPDLGNHDALDATSRSEIADILAARGVAESVAADAVTLGDVIYHLAVDYLNNDAAFDPDVFQV